jgi:hypothetical protein
MVTRMGAVLATVPTPPTPTTPIDPASLSESRLQERFSTYQRFFGFVAGWDVNGVRVAIDAHDSGSFGLSALLKVVITRYFGVDGPLERRLAPPLGIHTEVTGGERGIARVAREEFGDIVADRVVPYFADIFEDHAMLGMSVLHHPWVRSPEGTWEPDLRPWPLLAVRYNWLTQRYEAYTAERGLVPIEGPCWTIVGNGVLPHLRGKIRVLADPWTEAKYGQRDEASLSNYLGRKVPIGILPPNIEPKSPQGKDIGDAVKTLGMARAAGIFPNATEITSLDNLDPGAAALFEGYMRRRLAALSIALTGTDGASQVTSPGVYLSPEFANIGRHVVRRDLQNGGRALTRLGLLYSMINYPQLRRDQAPGFRWLLPDPEEQARLEAEAKRAISYGQIVKGWRDAGLDPEEHHLEDLATKLRTQHIPESAPQNAPAPAQGDAASALDAPAPDPS